MKYANLLHASGAVVVIIATTMKIFHLDLVNSNLLLTLGFLLGYIGQSYKIKLLEARIKENEVQAKNL